MQRKARNAVIALAAGVILALSILVVNARLPSPSAAVNPPIGGPGTFAFSGSADSSTGTENWYNMTIIEVSPPMILGRISFELMSPSGSDLPPSGSGVNIVAPDGLVEASYAFDGTGTYGAGYSASTPLADSDLISVYLYISGVVTSLSGYTLVVHASVGTFSGPIT